MIIARSRGVEFVQEQNGDWNPSKFKGHKDNAMRVIFALTKHFELSSTSGYLQALPVRGKEMFA